MGTHGGALSKAARKGEDNTTGFGTGKHGGRSTSEIWTLSQEEAGLDGGADWPMKGDRHT